MWRKSLSFTSPVKPDFHFLPLHTTPNTCRRRFARLSRNRESQIYVVYYILTAYVCQFQNGKVLFCSSTGVQMSSQNIHSIFGPSYLSKRLGVYCVMRHFSNNHTLFNESMYKMFHSRVGILYLMIDISVSYTILNGVEHGRFFLPSNHGYQGQKSCMD